MNRLLITALAAGALFSVQAQSTNKLSASKATDYGIVYSLPITVLDITFETEFTQQQPGPFSNYANRTLNISDAITKPSLSAQLKSITIEPKGIPDVDNPWLLQLRNGQNMYVILDDNGVPIAINTENIPAQVKQALPVAQAAQPTPLEVPAAKQAITQEMTMSTSLSKRASLAADRIFELRDNRNDLISGQADNTPPDGQSMQLALDNLSAQEAALTAMFAGTEKKWTEVNTITFKPYDGHIKNVVIARLSPTDGIVDSQDLSGAPIYLSLETIAEGATPLNEKGEEKPFPKNGVAYNIPGTAKITVTFDGKIVKSQQVELAQLGITYGLDPKIFTDKKAPAFLLLDPATGAIRELGIK